MSNECVCLVSKGVFLPGTLRIKAHAPVPSLDVPLLRNTQPNAHEIR